jgi:exopolyphosphatase/guanosine-5'-triphosphate,3'-diphosphate pyrophosphatase
MPGQPTAIIDIGSNSVRLVVYSGNERVPSTIFNEKVMAGLGKGLQRTGELAPAAQERALAAMRRFRLLTRQMEVERVCVVATAAVRDASNGGEFLGKVKALGFAPRILSGEEEGIMAGQGVLSSIPDADGIVGDLGGGSLELVDVEAGRVVHSASTPLGVLRLDALLDKGEASFARRVAKTLEAAGFKKKGRKRPFYLVGGSWRTLARLDMSLTDYPLPILHHYRMSPDRLVPLQDAVAGLDADASKNIPYLSSSRVPTLPGATMLLKALSDELRPSELVVSSYGIREGLLYDELTSAARAGDPLIEAAREAGSCLGRFAEHGDLLDRWIAPIFEDPPETARLRLAACLLADVAWQAHPDFRAERGVDMALHGNWVGIDGPGRVMIAQALFSTFGGSGRFGDLDVARICPEPELRRASLWGLAIRLGQRLSGGVATSLGASRLTFRGETLRLEISRDQEALFGETVERRLKSLANALGRPAEAVAV